MVHDTETFAGLIEARMQALEINQVELERRSGITDTSWAGWRAGRLPSIKAFWPIIATTLQVPLEQVQAVIERDRSNRTKPVTRIDTVEDTQAWIAKQDPTPVEQGG
jgi:hypothetical protein